MEIGGIPIFYIVPILIFGPILFGVLWSFGLKDLFRQTPQDIEEKRQRQEAEQAARHSRKGGKPHFTRGGGPGKGPMPWIVQGIAFTLFMALLGLYSAWPPYAAQQPETAMIKLSLSHAGKHQGKCVKVTRAQLDKLTPQERRKVRVSKCGRERWPVTVELELDGKQVYSGTARPRGLSEDGPSSFYEKFVVPAGEHRILVRMRDGAPDTDFNHSTTRVMTLAPAQSVVVSFHNASDEFVIE